MPLTRGEHPLRRNVHRDSNEAVPSGAASYSFPPSHAPPSRRCRLRASLTHLQCARSGPRLRLALTPPEPAAVRIGAIAALAPAVLAHAQEGARSGPRLRLALAPPEPRRE